MARVLPFNPDPDSYGLLWESFFNQPCVFIISMEEAMMAEAGLGSSFVSPARETWVQLGGRDPTLGSNDDFRPGVWYFADQRTSSR